MNSHTLLTIFSCDSRTQFSQVIPVAMYVPAWQRSASHSGPEWPRSPTFARCFPQDSSRFCSPRANALSTPSFQEDSYSGSGCLGHGRRRPWTSRHMARSRYPRDDKWSSSWLSGLTWSWSGDALLHCALDSTSPLDCIFLPEESSNRLEFGPPIWGTN